jgi:hypothetical protein
MRLVILLYFLVGDTTAGRFTGRVTLVDKVSLAWVIAGNAVAAALFLIGLRHAMKRGKFLGFDKRLWVASTVSCYLLGIVLNFFFGMH